MIRILGPLVQWQPVTRAISRYTHSIVGVALGTSCMVQWLKLPTWKVGDRELVSPYGNSYRSNVVRNLRDREVACPTIRLPGLEFCDWRAPSSGGYPSPV